MVNELKEVVLGMTLVPRELSGKEMLLLKSVTSDFFRVEENNAFL